LAAALRDPQAKSFSRRLSLLKKLPECLRPEPTFSLTLVKGAFSGKMLSAFENGKSLLLLLLTSFIFEGYADARPQQSYHLS